MTVYDKLMTILEFTLDSVIDDMWPDKDMSLDQIAGELLTEHAKELGVEQ